MTANAPNDPGPSPGDQRLPPVDYAPGPRRRMRTGLQVMMVAIASAAVLLAIASTLPFLLGMLPTLATLGLVAAVFVFGTIRARGNPASRGRVMGMLIGVGLAFLIYGTCWMYVEKSFEH